MSNLRNGEADEYGHRWCRGHDQFHGPLYPCSTYPEPLRLLLRLWAANLGTPEWAEEQLAQGVPGHVVAIFQVLAGH